MVSHWHPGSVGYRGREKSWGLLVLVGSTGGKEGGGWPGDEDAWALQGRHERAGRGCDGWNFGYEKPQQARMSSEGGYLVCCVEVGLAVDEQLHHLEVPFCAKA